MDHVNVGVLGGVKHAQRLAGPQLARRMLYTGELVSADELYRRGAIEQVVPPDDLLRAATARVKRHADSDEAREALLAKPAPEVRWE